MCLLDASTIAPQLRLSSPAIRFLTSGVSQQADVISFTLDAHKSAFVQRHAQRAYGATIFHGFSGSVRPQQSRSRRWRRIPSPGSNFATAGPSRFFIFFAITFSFSAPVIPELHYAAGCGSPSGFSWFCPASPAAHGIRCSAHLSSGSPETLLEAYLTARERIFFFRSFCRCPRPFCVPLAFMALVAR